jgi:hypothetical protein
MVSTLIKDYFDAVERAKNEAWFSQREKKQVQALVKEKNKRINL